MIEERDEIERWRENQNWLVEGCGVSKENLHMRDRQGEVEERGDDERGILGEMKSE